MTLLKYLTSPEVKLGTKDLFSTSSKNEILTLADSILKRLFDVQERQDENDLETTSITISSTTSSSGEEDIERYISKESSVPKVAGSSSDPNKYCIYHQIWRRKMPVQE